MLISEFLCTVTITGLIQYQENYACKTCGISNVCKYCIQICHYNHMLTRPVTTETICKCGVSDYCLIKKTPSLRVQCKSFDCLLQVIFIYSLFIYYILFFIYIRSSTFM